ncbi:hypothetical protein ACQKEN_14790 [Pseudomonas sp. NPDC078416]|uniref:hypothetical protein n=1 Tax=Pseudomonas sp. NPDC078416 TaxID=3390637 RepID=UPI003D040CD9
MTNQSPDILHSRASALLHRFSENDQSWLIAKSVGAGLLANAVDHSALRHLEDWIRGQARSYRFCGVPGLAGCQVEPLILPRGRKSALARERILPVTNQPPDTLHSRASALLHRFSENDQSWLIAKSVGTGLLANAVGHSALRHLEDWIRGQARSYRFCGVPGLAGCQVEPLILPRGRKSALARERILPVTNQPPDTLHSRASALLHRFSENDQSWLIAKSVGTGLLANAVGHSALRHLEDWIRGQARSYRFCGNPGLAGCQVEPLILPGGRRSALARERILPVTNQPPDILHSRASALLHRFSENDQSWLIAKSVGAGLLANAVGHSALRHLEDWIRGQARSYRFCGDPGLAGCQFEPLILPGGRRSALARDRLRSGREF